MLCFLILVANIYPGQVPLITKNIKRKKNMIACFSSKVRVSWTSNKQNVTNNKQKVTSNKKNETDNEQKVTRNEQKTNKQGAERNEQKATRKNMWLPNKLALVNKKLLSLQFFEFQQYHLQFSKWIHILVN